jgi:nucleoside 2-deoxyribosyltransferase
MLEELFSTYDYEIVAARSGVTMGFLITCSKLRINESLFWNSNEDLVALLKPLIHRFIAVLSNGLKLNNRIVYDSQSLATLIDDNYHMLLPDAKLDSILEYLNKQTSYEGEIITLQFPDPIDIARMYFTNIEEWVFYLNTAINLNLINQHDEPYPSQPYENEYTYRLTVGGLSRLIKATSGKDSTTCFIAMAFRDDMLTIAEEVIKPALTSTGFKSYILIDQHVDSDTTINDAILAGIKKAKFTIADFTYHRGGVYFEAGYALGRGQKVIYTCREDEMSKAHFDIRNYQHIVWTDAEDLRVKLINKIEAFIKD